MRIEQKIFENNTWRDIGSDLGFAHEKAQLILVFLGIGCIDNTKVLSEIRALYPKGSLIFTSTAGEIISDEVHDDSITVTAIEFERTSIMTIAGEVTHSGESEQIGYTLAKGLTPDKLKHILVFADGIHINGTSLIEGIKKGIGKNITISGGLAADAGKFTQTYVALNKLPDAHSQVVLVGLYGDITVGLGSVGGWEAYGDEMIVTRSSENVVYELDHTPILDLYKGYLGELSHELPSSGLLFPLSIIGSDDKDTVRTLLGTQEADKSITFAGNIPTGSRVRLMRANFNKIIRAAGDAANDAKSNIGHPEFALLVSCVGRKLILKEKVKEEVENVKSICGDNCKIAGFYSNGEIGKRSSIILDCELHNQTMTVTLLSEV